MHAASISSLPHSHILLLQYEPELFPGLIYRMKSPKIVLLIFVSGKVVLTGACPAQDSPPGCLPCWLPSLLSAPPAVSACAEQAVRRVSVPRGWRLFGADCCDSLHRHAASRHELRFFASRHCVTACALSWLSALQCSTWEAVPLCAEIWAAWCCYFSDGSICPGHCTAGGKQRIDLYQAFENIYPVLQQFKKGDVAQPGPQPQQQAQLPPGQALPALPAPPPAAPQQQRQLPPLGGFGAPQQHMQYPGGR